MKCLAKGLLALLIGGCQWGPLTTPGETPDVSTGSPGKFTPAGPVGGTAVELRVDETVTAGELRLRWLELDDSRCPLGVQCVWEGQAVVTLEVVRGAEVPARVELTLRPGTEAAAQIVAEHELRLLDVRPCSREGVSPERGDHVATVEIRQEPNRRRPAAVGAPEKSDSLKMSRELLALVREYQAHQESGAVEEFRPSASALQIRAGRVAIECTAVGDLMRLVAGLEKLEATGIATYGGRVSGWLPIPAVPKLADLESLRFARAAMAMKH